MPKSLALRALERTTKCLWESFASFPKRRWRESPGGRANSFQGVLTHLYWCEDWWRLNIGSTEPDDEEIIRQQLEACSSARELIALFNRRRRRLLRILAAQPEGFFDDPVPTCHHGGLRTGAELCLYMGEHDFYHAGQIQMLEMALAEGKGGRR